MRYIELFEDGDPRVDTIARQRTVFDKIKQECAVAISKIQNDNLLLFRGNSSVEFGKIGFADSTRAGPRKSPYAYNNYYMWLFSDILPSWNSWPNRSLSFIGTTDLNRAVNRHTPCLVLPIGDPEIAFCSDSDIWESFPNVLNEESINNLNKALDALFQNELSSSAELYSEIKEFDKLPLEEKVNRLNEIWFGYRQLLYKFLVENSLLKGLDQKLSPENNRFIKGNLSTMKKLSDREFWFSGKAYLIGLGIYDGKNVIKDVLSKLGVSENVVSNLII